MSTRNTSTVAATIGDIFRNASVTQARQHTGCETLKVLEMDDNFNLGQVVDRQMTLIVISGAEMSILFKIHFNNSTSDRFRKLKFSDAPAGEAAITAKNMDYIKELANQICGRICRVFQSNNLTLGMCIPLTMRGFYELYADYTPSDKVLTKFGQSWKIAGDFGSFVCTAYVEIADLKSVSHLQQIDEQASNDDDELEFL